MEYSEKELKSRAWTSAELLQLKRNFNDPLTKRYISLLSRNVNADVRAWALRYLPVGETLDALKREKDISVLRDYCSNTWGLNTKTIPYLVSLNNLSLLKPLVQNPLLSQEDLRTIYSFNRSVLNDFIVSHHAVPKEIFDDLVVNASQVALKRISKLLAYTIYDFGSLPSHSVERFMNVGDDKLKAVLFRKGVMRQEDLNKYGANIVSFSVEARRNFASNPNSLPEQLDLLMTDTDKIVIKKPIF